MPKPYWGGRRIPPDWHPAHHWRVIVTGPDGTQATIRTNMTEADARSVCETFNKISGEQGYKAEAIPPEDLDRPLLPI